MSTLLIDCDCDRSAVADPGVGDASRVALDVYDSVWVVEMDFE